MSRRLLVVWLTGLLVLTGCADAGDGGDGDVPPIGGEESEESSEPDDDESDDSEDEAAADIDVTVVPDEITEDYVEAVLAELERIRAKAIEVLRQENGEFTLVFMDLTQSVFTADEVQYERDDLGNLADADFEPIRDDISPVEPVVTELLNSSEVCIWVETEVSFEGLREGADAEKRPRLYHLVLKDTEPVEDHNPTPWVISGTPGNVEDVRGDDRCA